MTVDELIRRPVAEYEAAKQYAKAIERHFDHAHRLVLEGKLEAAERIAKGAAALRMDAAMELRSE